MAIPKGATTLHTFNVPIDLTQAVVLYITYQSLGEIILEKQLDDCEVTTDCIKVNLSQEETLLFEDSVRVKIQIRARLYDGSAVKSKVIETTTDELLKEGVI